MDIIPEFKRDDSKDHLQILKALNEIPFPVGKRLLIDFMGGDLANPSVEKNSLFDLHNFGGLSVLSKFQIEELVDELASKKYIDTSPVNFNKFVKVYGITQKGKDELLEPKLKFDGVKYEEVKTKISDAEFAAFKELQDFMGHFNPEQKKAIISNKEKILCIAGAGSGKTSVLTKRIEFLNKYRSVNATNILAITFTKRAKEEMQARLNDLRVKVKVETFNSFCEKTLLRNTGKIYGRRMRVASYGDKFEVLNAAISNCGLTLQQAIVRYFSEGQRKNKTINQLQNSFMNDCFSVLDYFKANKKDFGNFSEGLLEKDKLNAKMVHDIVLNIDKELKRRGLRTYSDQIIDALNFFKQNSKNIPEFDHILVDEFQDVNDSQVELLNLLNSPNLFCVGDPRQSIFGWRGSDISHILNFVKKHEGSETINLVKNYRSSKPIVNLLNKSIRKMKLSDLEAHKEGEKFMKLSKFNNDVDEEDFICKSILERDEEDKEIFVLARTNKQLMNLSRKLKIIEIPHVLRTDENSKDVARKGEVTLATIHSIKGLEADTVFIMGCNNVNFPCKASEHPILEIVKMYDYDKDEEERRLFYVALSRAKNKLYLTYTGNKPTNFINEEMQRDLE